MDGEVVPGLQSISYKVERYRQSINTIGRDERIGVDYGPVLVHASMTVRSAFGKFDTILAKAIWDVTPFQLVIELKTTAIGTKAWGQPFKTLTFDECYLVDKTFSIDANGVGTSTYTFTATRLREQ